MGNQMFHTDICDELMADISTSPDAQQFKYGGKELDRSFGLDLYDFHARQQDAKLGRFNSIDPLAYKNPWASPYTYCNGDPVNQIDPDGECPVIVVTIVIGAVVGGVVSGTIAYANGARGKNFWRIGARMQWQDIYSKNKLRILLLTKLVMHHSIHGLTSRLVQRL